MAVPVIRREFGIINDSTSGGTVYDSLTGSPPAPPDATEFWPVTSVTLDKNVEQYQRTAEVRGRRPVPPPRPFRSAPVLTVQVPAYRSILERGMKKVLSGADTVTPGTGAGPQTHAIAALGYGAGPLQCTHAQVVRDDLNHKLSGCVWERGHFNFPLDGEGTLEFNLNGLYHSNFTSAIPSAVYTGLSDDVMMLRDAQAWYDGATEVQLLTMGGTPTGGNFTVTLPQSAATPAGTYGTTGNIAYNAASSAVQTAFDATFGAGNTVVTGSAGGPWTVTFAGQLAGRDLPAMTTNNAGLTGGTTPAVTVTTSTPGGAAIDYLSGFQFTFVNNSAVHWWPKRNVVTQTIGTPTQTRKLWFPQERRLGAAQDATGSINFGTVSAAQELAHEFAQMQKMVFEVTGSVLATTPASVELLRLTVYAGVHENGGAEALTARDDITSTFEFRAGFSDADNADMRFEVVNATTTPIP